MLCCGIIHFLLLAYCAHQDSFTFDEVAHLPSGLFHWEQGRFGMFRVNPPLVRLVATLPLMWVGYQSDWSSYSDDIAVRPEWAVSFRFLELNGVRSFWLLTVARMACLPFSLLGMWICWRWAGELFGNRAAILAATIWCFSPNILGHGHLISPDVASASIGIAAFYSFRHWLLSPNWSKALLAGFVFGQAQSARTSWIPLFGMWPLLWLILRKRARCQQDRSVWAEGAQMAIIVLLGIWSVNAWYGFEGTLTPLGDYQFLSKSLGGGGPEYHGEMSRNRFRATWLGRLPVPLPREYVQGIDRQRYHFESIDQSYLRGEWRDRGWWYYYIYAAFIKEPCGYWMVAGIALVLGLASSDCRASWREEVFLLFPLITMLVFISSQQGFNRHLRYILPVFPFAIILASRAALSVGRGDWRVTAVVLLSIGWGALSSLSIYPHSLGYFNEVAGGPQCGHRHLLGSNVDWGQDLLYFKSWLEAHPEASPLRMTLYNEPVVTALAGIAVPNLLPEPTPGWHAISVNNLHLQDGRYAYFLKTTPVAMAGYSIFIYQLSSEDCLSIKADSEGHRHGRPFR